VFEARTGTDTLALAREKQPAVVVLATELPGLDGFTVSKRLKSDPRTSSIPVLHLSGLESSRDYPESLLSGADAYLQLPVEPAVLIATITALVQARFEGAERERAEAALRAREEKLRLTLDAAGIGTFEHNVATHESYWDRRAKAVWGLPPDADIVYPQLIERIHPEDRARMREMLEEAARTESDVLSGVEYRVIWPNGEVHWIFGATRTFFEGAVGQRRAARMIGFHRDITDSKRAEALLREAQKLESLGLLAGGVAHDFNNLLVGVIGNASLAREMLSPDHPAAELLDRVIKTGQQAAHLTRQMLAYSGKGKFLVEALNLSALIPEMAGLVRTSIAKKIALHLDLDEPLPFIQADRGQIQQVFMNLVLNAAEAIGSHDGLITIKTGVRDVDERFIRLHAEAAALLPGKYVCLEVRDTGCGMDDATKARVFDPFFSTKFTGRGLGLAAVAGIMRGHRGAIVVSSAPGKGSCFTVLFAAAQGPAEERPVAAHQTALQGSGVVLVVDDEEFVREMVKRALVRSGYTVLLAESGSAAIDLLKRHAGDIALVVLDLSMPHMNGEEALPELRKIRPEVKVLVSSGYSESETMALFKGQRVSGFIQKPYTGAGLAEKVKACLE
jgi:PAS domain S-box-containing protein